MVLSAFRGALGFLTTLPVGHSKAAWEAFATCPVVMVPVGYVLGALLSLPLVFGLPDAIVGFTFVLGVGLFAGINNFDGLLDVADGVATHGNPEAARAAMKDSAIGVGAVLALGVVLLGLFAVGFTLSGSAPRVLGTVVAAEVGAKLGMVTVLARGTASHEGLGSALSSNATIWTLPLGVLLALPAALLTLPHPAGAVAVTVGVTTGVVVERWARDRLGGINGDVLGATNEIARLAALLAGVIAWTLW
ncbi:adenosylcobinamide-GDP ribazoletransferase [Halodesulfurarchaeum sp.]|uniref:adenosylcobinamide-GDP ribazoletransferase n=1 Tax=Halodesulfurarchaeum sp. TaxID=1980530 RepID=UPI002FC30F23